MAICRQNTTFALSRRDINNTDDMNKRDEEYLLESIERIKDEVHENNIMLRQIIRVVNTHIARHHQENNDDFGRNVLANLISSGFDLNKIFRRK